MSPTAEQLDRLTPPAPLTNLIHPQQPSPYSGGGRAPHDRFGAAMGEASLALANVDRALRQQPPATSPLDVHPQQLAARHARALEAVIQQHPAAVLEAIADAAEELRVLVETAVSDPESAIATDPERMKDVSAAWVRKVITAYRESLAGQLAVLRSVEGQG